MPSKKMMPSKSSSKSAKPAKTAKTAKAVKTASKSVKKASPKAAKPASGLGGTLKKMLGKHLKLKTAEPSKEKKAKTVKESSNSKTKLAAAPKGAETAKKGKKGRISLADQVGVRSPAPIASGPAVCREVACELMATTGTYCRMHYIKNWKKIKRKEIILKERKLNSYIEELVSKYPDKYIEAIRQDLSSEKDFSKVIADLEIDEGIDDFELDDAEGAEGLIDNLKRDFDDDGDVF